jgi:hypothetical protein
LGTFDTAVRRLASTPPLNNGGNAVVPIEIIQLNLVSVNPIVVTYNAGQNPEQWNVQLTLPPAPPQQQGPLSITLNNPSGGTFTATLPVQPRFTFTRPAPPATQTFDLPFPIQLSTSGPTPWVTTPPPGVPVVPAGANFFPGVSYSLSSPGGAVVHTVQNAQGPPSAIPAMGPLSLGALAALLLGVGVIAMQRRA